MTLIEVRGGYKGSDVCYVEYPESVFEDSHLLEGFADPQTGKPAAFSCSNAQSKSISLRFPNVLRSLE